mmetsp:Transcript_52222/g.96187  ORF Transcript_52222/g.96187 Transcript_52222/m.96187 type:complete len:145 (-) Transcript_52222:530-964(-)
MANLLLLQNLKLISAEHLDSCLKNCTHPMDAYYSRQCMYMNTSIHTYTKRPHLHGATICVQTIFAASDPTMVSSMGWELISFGIADPSAAPTRNIPMMKLRTAWTNSRIQIPATAGHTTEPIRPMIKTKPKAVPRKTVGNISEA